MLRSLDSYLLALREKGEEALRAEIGSPMLVVFAPEMKPSDDAETEVVTSEVALRAREMALANTSMGWSAQGAYAIAVAKGSDGSSQEPITVGRDSDSDICIPDASLSKLHAHFTPVENDSFAVSDAGSRNGTFIEDERLEPDESRTLKVGDTIQLGAVVAVFHSPETFLRFTGLLVDASA